MASQVTEKKRVVSDSVGGKAGGISPIRYVDTPAAAALTGLTVEAVNIAARSGRIPGAIKQGSVRRGTWQIPLNSAGGVDVVGRRKPYAPRRKAAA